MAQIAAERVMNSTLARLAPDLDSERTTSEALTAGAFAAIDAPEGEGERAFTEVDRQPARAVAAAVELWRREAGHALPLAGIPVSQGSLRRRERRHTRWRADLRRPQPGPTDAVIVQRLRAAGAVIIGRTNMTEFAYSGRGINPHYGTPLNPWGRDVGRFPGDPQGAPRCR